MKKIISYVFFLKRDGNFRAEMHQNNVFYFFKIIFEISVSKRSKTHKNSKHIKQ
jgi:hypothetical protein